jgi:hypothetical protein
VNGSTGGDEPPLAGKVTSLRCPKNKNLVTRKKPKKLHYKVKITAGEIDYAQRHLSWSCGNNFGNDVTSVTQLVKISDLFPVKKRVKRSRYAP